MTNYYTLKLFKRFKPSHPDKDDFKNNSKTMENTVVFLISTYQYVTLAFVYSRGPPYRRPISDNFFFILSLLVLMALNIWITLTPLPFILDILSV